MSYKISQKIIFRIWIYNFAMQNHRYLFHSYLFYEILLCVILLSHKHLEIIATILGSETA